MGVAKDTDRSDERGGTGKYGNIVTYFDLAGARGDVAEEGKTFNTTPEG